MVTVEDVGNFDKKLQTTNTRQCTAYHSSSLHGCIEMGLNFPLRSCKVAGLKIGTLRCWKMYWSIALISVLTEHVVRYVLFSARCNLRQLDY